MTKQTLENLRLINEAAKEKGYLTVFGQHAIPDYEVRIDGRTLRGLEKRGLIRMRPHDNGKRDPRYWNRWHDLSLTDAGIRALGDMT